MSCVLGIFTSGSSISNKDFRFKLGLTAELNHDCHFNMLLRFFDTEVGR